MATFAELFNEEAEVDGLLAMATGGRYLECQNCARSASINTAAVAGLGNYALVLSNPFEDKSVILAARIDGFGFWARFYEPDFCDDDCDATLTELVLHPPEKGDLEHEIAKWHDEMIVAAADAVSRLSVERERVANLIRMRATT